MKKLNKIKENVGWVMGPRMGGEGKVSGSLGKFHDKKNKRRENVGWVVGSRVGGVV